MTKEVQVRARKKSELLKKEMPCQVETEAPKKETKQKQGEGEARWRRNLLLDEIIQKWSC